MAIDIGGGSYVTAKSYGAIGDGVADDTEAFETAVNSGVKTLKVTEGTYLITETLFLNNPITIIGEGEVVLALGVNAQIVINAENCRLENVVVRHDTKNNVSILQVNNAAEIIGCEFDGLYEMTDYRGSTAGGNGIDLGDDASNTVIRDCYIHNVKSGLIEGWHNRTAPRAALTNLVIENNRLHDSETGDAIALCASDSLVANNHIYGKVQDCIVLHADTNANCERVVFSGNTINVNGTSYNIALRPSDDATAGCIDCKIINNFFLAISTQAVLVHTGSVNSLVSGNSLGGDVAEGASGIVNYGENTLICNNNIQLLSAEKSTGVNLIAGTAIVSDNTIVAAKSVGNAISITSTLQDKQIISNNFIQGSGGISAPANSVVNGNNICATTATAITLSGNNILVQDNVIRAAQDGIHFPGNQSNCLVTGNRIEEAGRHGILCRGADNCIINNIVNGTTTSINSMQNSGVITIRGNTVNANIRVNSADVTYFVEDNNLGGALIEPANTGAMTVFANNNVNYLRIVSAALVKIVENGVAKQAASPASADAANIWGSTSLRDMVKKYNIIVEDTSATPYQRYVLRSDNTWQAVYN